MRLRARIWIASEDGQDPACGRLPKNALKGLYRPTVGPSRDRRLASKRTHS